MWRALAVMWRPDGVPITPEDQALVRYQWIGHYCFAAMNAQRQRCFLFAGISMDTPAQRLDAEPSAGIGLTVTKVTEVTHSAQQASGACRGIDGC
ncbi:hypothetical protein THIOKS13220002 [Thiocapsa sp. KS1]|nr:hypothetical protein THIOKS13220002 [Thiocapsa sp. KS1]